MASAMALDSSEDLSQLLTTADVGELMGITQPAVRYLEKRKILKGRRLTGGMLVFRRSDVEDAIRERANAKPRVGRPYKAAKRIDKDQ